MLHWAKSFSIVAAAASLFALSLYPAALGFVALFMSALFVALTLLALFTGALGKGRDGTYCAERAFGRLACIVSVVLAARALSENGVSVDDVRGAVEALRPLFVGAAA